MHDTTYDTPITINLIARAWDDVSELKERKKVVGSGQGSLLVNIYGYMRNMNNNRWI